MNKDVDPSILDGKKNDVNNNSNSEDLIPPPPPSLRKANPAPPPPPPSQKTEQPQPQNAPEEKTPLSDNNTKTVKEVLVPTQRPEPQATSETVDNTGSHNTITGSCKDYDYVIYNDDCQLIEISLKQNTGLIYHQEAITAYDDGIELKSEMNTGDAPKKGILGKIMDAGKSVAKGEKVFITSCNNNTLKTKKVVLSAIFPGSIVAINLDKTGEVIFKDGTFLCGSKSIHVAKAAPNESGSSTFSTGLKLGKLEGNGMAFLGFQGGVYKRTLAEGEVVNVIPSYIAARQGSVSFAINKKSENGKTRVFETVTGPVDVWIQSSPFIKLRDKIISNVLAVVKEINKKQMAKQTQMVNQLKTQINSKR